VVQPPTQITKPSPPARSHNGPAHTIGSEDIISVLSHSSTSSTHRANGNVVVAIATATASTPTHSERFKIERRDRQRRAVDTRAGAHSPKQRRVLVQSPLALAVLHLVARPVHNGAVQCSQCDGQCVGDHTASQERHLTHWSCVIVGKLSEVGTRRRERKRTPPPPHPVLAQCAHLLTCSRAQEKRAMKSTESVVQHQHDNLSFTHSARMQRPATASARSHGGVRPEADRTRVNRAQRGNAETCRQTHTRTLLTHTHTHTHTHITHRQKASSHCVHRTAAS
jgi:hypothetical protein